MYILHLALKTENKNYKIARAIISSVAEQQELTRTLHVGLEIFVEKQDGVRVAVSRELKRVGSVVSDVQLAWLIAAAAAAGVHDKLQPTRAFRPCHVVLKSAATINER